MINEAHYLPMPLFDVLRKVSYKKKLASHRFDVHSLFKSLTRLFAHYERIMSVVELPKVKRPFLEVDLENFIIRFQVVLNDIAFLVRCFLPKEVRGLKGLKGPVHPLDKEMSINDLMKFLSKQDHDYPELADIFKKASIWIEKLRTQRNNLLHYKAHVLVFNFGAPTFALKNRGALTSKEPVKEFVNEQTVSLYHFINEDLKSAIENQMSRENLPIEENAYPSDTGMTCIGTQRFKYVNNIG